MEAGPSETHELQTGQVQEETIQINEEEEEVYEDGIITEMEGEEIEGDYDCNINNHYDANVLYELYQPLEMENMLMCRICHHMGKTVTFPDRTAYNTHRYKVHGSFNNSIICPIGDCKDAFASTIHLRRHLMQLHQLPLEMHHQVFINTVEFEKWRNLVEQASHCRFLMHTKQPNRKRQIIHCSRSEHKQVLQSRTRKLPRKRMLKEGACCPAVISYRQDDRTGIVHAFYQLYHVGHAIGEETDLPGEDASHLSLLTASSFQNRPLALNFVDPPTYVGDRPMQYIQIDFVEMESSVYQSLVYNTILIITDLKTGFTWAKPMIDPLSKTILSRIVCDLFCQYGIPDGFGCSSGPYQAMLRDCLISMEDVFQVQIREIHNEAPDYDGFRAIVLEQANEDLKSHSRWAEVVPFSTMHVNQAIGKVTAFERFFKRKPHSIHPPPYVIPEEKFDEDIEEFNPPPPTITYNVKNKVYIRNVDFRQIRNGMYPTFYHGVIGEIDFANSPNFPYKVFYSKTDEVGPNENCPSVWVSPFDILPTTQDFINMSEDESQQVLGQLLCACKDGTSEEPCTLFRSYVCANAMSKACCARSGKRCGYHENSTGDDSYTKMEKLTKYFSSECTADERRQLKTMLKLNRGKQTGGFLSSDSGQYGESLTADEVGGGGYYMPGEESPPVKKRRHPVRPGAGSIILKSMDGQVTKEMTYKPPGELSSVSTGHQSHFATNDEREPFQQNEAPLEEDYEAETMASSRQPKDSVRRSGRASKARIYKDFVAE